MAVRGQAGRSSGTARYFKFGAQTPTRPARQNGPTEYPPKRPPSGHPLNFRAEVCALDFGCVIIVTIGLCAFARVYTHQSGTKAKQP